MREKAVIQMSDNIEKSTAWLQVSELSCESGKIIQ